MKSAKLRWVLYQYKGHDLVILSKGFKTKEEAEKARLKYPDSTRKKEDRHWLGSPSAN